MTDCDDGLADKEKPGTVIVRVAGALTRPPLSVTVNDAVYVPGAEYVTSPAFAAELEAGTPPGNDQAYAAIVPSGSVPVPAKVTACPALTRTFAAGLVMVAVGA